MNWRRWIWPGILAVSTAAVTLAAVFNWQSPLRPLLTLWFMVICPGMALLRAFGLRLPISGWVLAIAFSLALDTAVGLGLLYSGRWSWPAGLAILAGLTLICAVIEILTPIKTGPEPVIVVTKVPAREKKSKKA